MTAIRQDTESLRREIDTSLSPIVLALQQAGWSAEQIKRELHQAVERIALG